jgi:hypothetical protein
MMAKFSFLLVCVALAGCSSGSTAGRRDAGTSSDHPSIPDSVVADSDGPAGPDENLGLPEAPPEAARSELVAVVPEVLADNVARVEASEALPREAGAADHAAEPSDAPATEVGAETAALDVAAQDSSGDVPAGTTYEVEPPVVDGSLASFCSGDSAHMIVNGIESLPAMSAHQLCYECCLAGDFIAVTATFSVPIQFAWRGLGGDQVVDLSNAPKGWQFSLVAGCDPTISSFECPLGTNTCATPGEVYQSGFRGTLEVERASDNNVHTSLCLHFEAPASATSPTIRRLDLYAPRVAWTN